MLRTFSPNRLTDVPVRLSALLSLVAWLIGSLPLAAAPPESCREALPLPLDHSIHGYATGREPARYAVEVTRPSLLLTEAHGTGSPPVSPAVGFLDRACRPQATNLPLPMIRGRHVHRVNMPGTYFVEVSTADLADGSFRLDAWLVPAPGSAAGVLKDGGDGGDPNEDPPREPMDEWDESMGGGIGGPIAAPILYKTPRLPVAWREIAGHGVVELVETSGGRETRVHP